MMKRKRAAASVLTAVVMVSSMGVSASGIYMKPVSTENADGAIYTYNSETDQYMPLDDNSTDTNIQATSYLAGLSTIYFEYISDEGILKKLKDAGIYKSSESKYEIDSIEKFRYIEQDWCYYLSSTETESEDGDNTVYCYAKENLTSGPSGATCFLIPNTILGWKVVAVRDSVCVLEFDLDPENEYMKCVDNVIFSKDGKQLMAYPSFNNREIYTVPDGTETICRSAFANTGSDIFADDFYNWDWDSSALRLSKGVVISDSVQCIEPYAFYNCKNIPMVVFAESDNHLVIEHKAFSYCDSLEEVILPSFDVEIVGSAFYECDNLSSLTTYAQPTLTSEGTTIRWEEIEGATYYEVYQKLNDGEYRLLGTTSGGGCRFTTLKEGKEYTFAVKAYAEIPAANYDPETDEGVYPESFLIEGTMSEDIVLVG